MMSQYIGSGAEKRATSSESERGEDSLLIRGKRFSALLSYKTKRKPRCVVHYSPSFHLDINLLVPFRK
jgi:hypothetical protein